LSLRIAVASGKGGTGKTTVAVNLALSLAEEHPVGLIDCDVEEPNAHLFLSPEIEDQEAIYKQLPVVDSVRCTGCGACVTSCQFGALARVGNRILVFDTLCHGCGRCRMVCPSGAIDEVRHELGVIEIGRAGTIAFAQGRLRVGEAMATPLIRALKRRISEERTWLLDAPPGTGCPTIATMDGADVVLLITEPTPFGLHDLRAAVGVARVLGLPVAVTINRDGVGDTAVDRYCREEGIPILLRIPFDREIASLYAEGIPLVRRRPDWKATFVELHRRLEWLATVPASGAAGREVS